MAGLASLVESLQTLTGVLDSARGLHEHLRSQNRVHLNLVSLGLGHQTTVVGAQRLEGRLDQSLHRLASLLRRLGANACVLSSHGGLSKGSASIQTVTGQLGTSSTSLHPAHLSVLLSRRHGVPTLAGTHSAHVHSAVRAVAAASTLLASAPASAPGRCGRLSEKFQKSLIHRSNFLGLCLVVYLSKNIFSVGSHRVTSDKYSSGLSEKKFAKNKPTMNFDQVIEFLCRKLWNDPLGRQKMYYWGLYKDEGSDSPDRLLQKAKELLLQKDSSVGMRDLMNLTHTIERLNEVFPEGLEIPPWWNLVDPTPPASFETFHQVMRQGGSELPDEVLLEVWNELVDPTHMPWTKVSVCGQPPNLPPATEAPMALVPVVQPIEEEKVKRQRAVNVPPPDVAEDECVICMHESADLVLSCKHGPFHEECISETSKSSRLTKNIAPLVVPREYAFVSCPMCRGSLYNFSPDEKQIAGELGPYRLRPKSLVWFYSDLDFGGERAGSIGRLEGFAPPDQQGQLTKFRITPIFPKNTTRAKVVEVFINRVFDLAFLDMGIVPTRYAVVDASVAPLEKSLYVLYMGIQNYLYQVLPSPSYIIAPSPDADAAKKAEQDSALKTRIASAERVIQQTLGGKTIPKLAQDIETHYRTTLSPLAVKLLEENPDMYRLSDGVSVLKTKVFPNIGYSQLPQPIVMRPLRNPKEFLDSLVGLIPQFSQVLDKFPNFLLFQTYLNALLSVSGGYLLEPFGIRVINMAKASLGSKFGMDQVDENKLTDLAAVYNPRADLDEMSRQRHHPQKRSRRGPAGINPPGGVLREEIEELKEMERKMERAERTVAKRSHSSSSSSSSGLQQRPIEPPSRLPPFPAPSVFSATSSRSSSSSARRRTFQETFDEVGPVVEDIRANFPPFIPLPHGNDELFAMLISVQQDFMRSYRFNVMEVPFSQWPGVAKEDFVSRFVSFSRGA